MTGISNSPLSNTGNPEACENCERVRAGLVQGTVKCAACGREVKPRGK